MKIVHISVVTTELNHSDARAEGLLLPIREKVAELGGGEVSVSYGFGSVPAIIVAYIPDNAELELPAGSEGLSLVEWKG